MSNKVKTPVEPKLDEYWVEFDLMPTYSVSNYGRVINNKTGHEVRIEIDAAGYSRAIMYRKGVKYRVYVHLLVALSFFLEYKVGVGVSFLNGNRQDCTVLNLTLKKAVRRT